VKAHSVAERFKKCTHLKQISDGDVWWFDTCVGKITDKKGKLSEEEIFGYVSELRKIYDNKWYREFRNTGKGIGPCPIPMMGGIQSPEFSILRLGQNLKTLGGVENLDNELVKRLQQFGTFLDASIEVEIGACFVEAGYKVELYPLLSSGKKCDMRVRVTNNWIYVEVTNLKPTESDMKSFRLPMNFVDNLHRIIPEKFSGIVKFTKKSPSKANNLIDEIILTIKEAYIKSGLPIQYNDENVNVKLKKIETGGTIKVEGLNNFQQKDEGRHLIERVLSKYDQLPEEGPGVIIANPVWLLAPQIGEGMIERLRGLFNSSLHTRVSGIIFSNKRAEKSGIIKTIPSIVINPYARWPCDADIEKLASALFKYPEWI